ncbi:MAG: HAD family hydrolase [Rhodanobacter sp.]
MAFRAALFDLDGTILDSAKCGELAMQEAFADRGFRVPHAAEILHWMGIPIEESFPALAGRHLPNSELDPLIDSFRASYRRHSEQHITVFKGVYELLVKLTAAGVALAIVTSKHSEVAFRNMASVGIDHFFSVVVGPDMVSRCKPFGDTALQAMRLLELEDGSGVIAIGDTSYDLEMGQAAAVSTCAVTWGAHSETQLLAAGPTFIVRTVEQLESVLLAA